MALLDRSVSNEHLEEEQKFPEFDAMLETSVQSSRIAVQCSKYEKAI